MDSYYMALDREASMCSAAIIYARIHMCHTYNRCTIGYAAGVCAPIHAHHVGVACDLLARDPTGFRPVACLMLPT